MTEDPIIAEALGILNARLRTGPLFTSPTDVKNYLCLKLGEREHEVFAVLFLDTHHRMIAFEEMFRGTLTHTSVYPREVVKSAIFHNAGAVIFCHNHCSGNLKPSKADEQLTSRLKDTLALIDVRVLDHIIVSMSQAFSFAENGIL